ncbi:GerAB/ArcD/ProY family transporter [Clostridium botulinum]|nr:GerAB/ArcD/ProY family transporter [Clostridium botulinum]
MRGPKEAFTEGIENNLSQINRRIKDKNLRIERFIIGVRSQTEVAMVYIEDIADEKIVNEMRKRLNLIKVDHIKTVAYIEQYMQNNTYTIFPQFFTTERPDVFEASIIEGRVGILMEGTEQGITAPAIFTEFFQTVEDYNQTFMLSTVIRLFRVIAVILVLSLTPIYLTFIKFNVELLPDKLLQPIIQSRVGIALNPIMEIISMELIVEFLREGGLRLPSKIGQTLSVVGGIIIGDAAIKSHLVSSTTLLVVGVSTVATFLIPNYEMSLAIRILKFPILFLTNALGIIGVSIGWFFILLELCSLDSIGVPYLQFKKSDMKDIFMRAPLWKMNKRPKAIPNKNPVRQEDFRKNLGGTTMENSRNNVLTTSQTIVIIVGSMLGIGILSLPANLSKIAHNDGWIGVVIGSLYPLYMGLCAILIFKDNSYQNTNIIEISKNYFGKILGSSLSFIFTFQFLLI